MAVLSLDPADEPHTQSQWERAAAGVLRRAGRLGDDDPDTGVWHALTTHTLDGIAVPPLGTAEQVLGIATGLPGQPPYVRGSAPARVDEGWDVRPWFTDPDPAATAEAALTDLENGATSLWLRLGPAGLAFEHLEQVLEGVLLDVAPVVLDAPDDPVGAAAAYLALAEERGLQPPVGTNLGADPIGSAVRAGRAPDDVDGVVGAVAERASEHLGVRALVVDATVVHDLGASDVQELAYSFAVGAVYLRSLAVAGVPADDACRLLEFRYAATDEQLVTIAKLRAARRGWHRLTELSGVTPPARAQHQHAVTSRPMASRYDPYVNLLRTTVAAFAAGVGGADAVTVLPFDVRLGLPDAFSRRLARNTSSLLVAESHVAAVTDPAGGAYAVERLTDDVARAAWAGLGQIDEDGGLPSAGLGALLARVDEVAERRRSRVAHRTQAITGLSEFPQLDGPVPERRPYPDGGDDVRAYGADFEALRDDPATEPVFLATMGPASAHTARATFATSLLAAGGVATVTAGPTGGVEDVLAAYDGAAVACLAGTDRDYAAWGSGLVAALRAAGARWVVVAGPPLDGTDDSAALGVDAVAFLRTVREHVRTEAAAAR